MISCEIGGIPGFLSQIGFKFNINRAPWLSALTTSVITPEISLSAAPMETPFRLQPITGDKPNYGPLTVVFKIDQDMKNYLEVFDWIKGAGYADNNYQYKQELDRPMGDGPYSDGSLIILNNNSNPLLEYKFKDIFPTSLSSIRMATDDEDVVYLEATATFEVGNMHITKI